MNVFVLDENRDWFLQQGRIDPMTRAAYRRGDRVVVCDECHTVFLESTWNDCEGCVAPGCNCKTTANRFLNVPAPKRNAEIGVLNQIVLRNGRVERQPESEAVDTRGENGPRMIVKNRRFYN